VEITAGTSASFDVYLTPNLSSGVKGSLSYGISFPGTVSRAFLGLYPMESIMESTAVTTHEIGLSSGATGTISALPEGSYRAVIDLYDGTNNKAAVRTEAVHIYGGLPTPLTRVFITDDFADCPPVIGAGLSSLSAKLDAALASDTGSYTIVLDGTETDLSEFTPKTLNVTGTKDIHIIIRGNGNEVKVGEIGTPLFSLTPATGSSLSLELRDLTLRGRTGNSVPVVWVNARGTLLMKAGSLITGNTSASSGGGVYVDNGTFTMSGGAVSDNTSSNPFGGGGVGVNNSGTFTMSGGAVSGNTSSSGGGGVGVNSWGTFTMSGGTVSGNTSSSGGGVGVAWSGAGTFTMSGGAVSGNTASSGGGVGVNNSPYAK
jgi:hypothetical protein